MTDLDWSAQGFLLSASVDNTVRLWHPSRDACVQVFAHADVVTSVSFHPVLPDVFCSGGFDKKIRVWDIPKKAVRHWAVVTALITSVAFSPDGGYVAAGLFQGQVFFYHTEGLRYHTQIECRNRRGKFKAGRKVTGLQFMPRSATSTRSAAAAAAAARARRAARPRRRGRRRRRGAAARPGAGAAAAGRARGGGARPRACSSRRTTRACACTGSTTSR